MYYKKKRDGSPTTGTSTNANESFDEVGDGIKDEPSRFMGELSRVVFRKRARLPTPDRPVHVGHNSPGDPIQRLHIPANAPSALSPLRPSAHSTGVRRVRQDRLHSPSWPARACRLPKADLSTILRTNESNARHVTVFTPPFGEPMGRQRVGAALSKSFVPQSHSVCARTLSTYLDHLHPIAHPAHPLLPHSKPEHVHCHTSSARDRRQYIHSKLEASVSLVKESKGKHTYQDSKT